MFNCTFTHSVMIVQKCVLVTLLLAIQCRADFLSFVPDPITNFNRFLIQDPIVRLISDFTGDAIVASQPITEISLVFARILGTKIQVPRIFHHNIASDFQENFFQQFNAGTRKEDSYLHITQLVKKYGYDIEEHTVQTRDGYVLTIHRMPPNTNQNSNKTTPVFLMHGLLGSSDDYVVAGPEHGLAFLLVDQGYNVWLGNARGNTHSKSHIDRLPTESEFWDFSWDEIGRYDLPAMIDYVIKTNEVSSLKYIGHSQGTTSFFVMCSERPEYNEKIEFMAALSPVAWMSEAISPMIRLMAARGNFIHGALTNLGINEFLPNHSLLKTLSHIVCSEQSITQLMCSNILFLTCGFSLEQINATNLPVILGHVPAGASVKQLVHYGQGIVSKEFQQFNYGSKGNLEKYKTERPPRYKVEQITAPIALFYSENDWLANPKDVDQLVINLPNIVDLYKIPRKQFNHIDFLWGVEAKELVFRRLLQLMENDYV